MKVEIVEKMREKCQVVKEKFIIEIFKDRKKEAFRVALAAAREFIKNKNEASDALRAEKLSIIQKNWRYIATLVNHKVSQNREICLE